MKKVFICTLLFAIYLLNSNSLFSQSFNKINKANNKLVSTWVKESNIPGLSIAIIYKNKLIWSNEYGLSNLEYKTPTSAESKFRIASVSKLFTGTAILNLHKKKKLNLDDSISKYLDSIPLSWKNITIRQIAQYTSGIGHYIDVADALDVHYYNSTKEAYYKFKNRPLQHEPNQGVTYSSYAYTVLAAVIEKVTGKKFIDAMEDIVFNQLDMNDTEVDDQKKIIAERTEFYQYDKNRNPEHAPYIDLSGRWAGSGYLSTAKDLAKFGAAHTFSSEIFTKEDLHELTAPRQINDSLKTKEGFGWGQRTDWEGRLMYWGDGKTLGSTCGLLVFPERELSIAIVSNMRNAPIDRGEFQILSIRLLAEIEGKKIKELLPKDFGEYRLNISIGKNVYKGKLNISHNNDNLGNFDFQGVQSFSIA